MYKMTRSEIKVPSTRLKVGAYVRPQASDPGIKVFRKGHEAKFTKD